MSENVVYPKKPNGFADHYPNKKWLFHWEYTQHFQTNPCGSLVQICRIEVKNREWSKKKALHSLRQSLLSTFAMAMTHGGGQSFWGYLEPIPLSQDEAEIQFPSNIIICNRNRGSNKNG